MNRKLASIVLGIGVLFLSSLLFYFLFSSGKDSDNDGVVDEKDHCPHVFGAIKNKGCPDQKSAKNNEAKLIQSQIFTFEKRVDSLMNGTMICPEHDLFRNGEHKNSVIVGRKLKYSRGKWYWDKNQNGPATIRINTDKHLYTIFEEEVNAINELEALNENNDSGDNENSDVIGISSLDEQGKLIFIDDCYILVAGALLYESDCKRWVQKQRSKDINNAGYLWIPDYPSLSGRENFATFFGPFNSAEDCASALQLYPKNQKFYYCKEVSMRNGALNPDDDEIRID